MKKILCFLLACVFCVSILAQEEKPLSKENASLYKDIFRALEKENISKAESLTEQLTDDSLLGYVLSEKYFTSSYRTKPEEIKDWFKKYSDLSVADRMYKLGEQKKVNLPKPNKKTNSNFGKAACTHLFKEEPIDIFNSISFKNLSKKREQEALKIKNRLMSFLKKGKTLTVKNILNDKHTIDLFSQRQLDTGRMALAFSYFLDGYDDQALEMAQKALQKSGKYLPHASWTAGLVSWRQGKIENALTYFQQTADNSNANDLLKAAASFWAARAHLKLGNYDKVGDYLEYAAKYPRTFYGLMALRVLGDDLTHIWAIPEKQVEEDIEVDFSHPALIRFYALKQIGKDDLAQQEISNLYLNSSQATKGILLMISKKDGFSKELLSVSGPLNEQASKYPVPNWKPQNGWQIDKALVYAYVRQESCFNPNAVSPMGARGLMQLMPQTAKEIARKTNVSYSSAKLKEPNYNLMLGQSYLQSLLNNSMIEGNLILTAVAYNAGPGNLEKWKKRMNYNKDPLLFIESIPSKETRGFVERIMVNFWIYKSLLGSSLNTLDDVISGKWPIYNK